MWVNKSIHSWSACAKATGVNLNVLKKLYKATASAQGVVHAAKGPEC